MTVHYVLNWKGRHEVCFKSGLTVKSKATELNSKARTTESKSFRLPCQVQRVEMSVVHTVDRVLHCTTTYTRAKSQALDFSTYRICCFGKRKKSHAWLALVIGIWTAVSRTPHLCEKTTFTKIINKNNEIAISAKEQTVVHQSNRPVALASMNIWVCSKRDFLWNQ